MRVPDVILKSVMFLGQEIGTDVHYGATAFLLPLERTRRPGRFFSAIATAAHTAKEIDGVPFRVRVNVMGGGFREVILDGTQWVYHPDPKVDCAVYPCMLPRDVDVLPMALGYSEPDGRMRMDGNMVLTVALRERLGIGVGDDVTIVGLFTKHYGKKENTPLIRTGALTMLPDEPINIGRGRELWAHLIEGRSIGGISGSPVFVQQTLELPDQMPEGGTPDGLPIKPRVGGPFYFLGLMHGHWNIDPARANEPVDETIEGGVNSGIAIVVPADKVMETLNHPRLIAIRKAFENRDMEREGTTILDSGFPE